MKKKWISTAIVLCALCVCAACGAGRHDRPRLASRLRRGRFPLGGERHGGIRGTADGMTTLRFDGTGDRGVSEALDSVVGDRTMRFLRSAQNSPPRG